MISAKFLKSSVIYSVIGALPLATSFVLLLFFANLLSTSHLGLLALYIVIALLVQILTNFALDTSIGVHYFEYKDQPDRLKLFISTVSGLLLVIGGIFILVMLLTGEILFTTFWPDDDLKFFPLGFLSVLTGISNSFFKTYTNLLINQERPERYFWMNILMFVLTIAFSLGLLFLFPDSLIGPIWGRFLASVLTAFLAFLFIRIEFGIRISTSFLPEIFSFCTPVFLFILFAWFLSSFDRFLIKELMQASDVAIFDFTVKCTVILEFIQNGLSAAITPKVFNLFRDQQERESTKEINRYFNGFTLVNIGIIPLLVIAIPAIIPLLVKNQDLYQGFAFVGLLCLGFVTRSLYTMYSLPIYYFKKTKNLPVIFAISAFIQVLLTIFGIRKFGLPGVVYAGLISKIIQVFLLYLFSRKVYSFKVNKAKQFFLPLLYFIVSVSAFFLFNKNPGLWVYVIQLPLIYFAAYLIYRKELRVLFQDLISGKLFSWKGKGSGF